MKYRARSTWFRFTFHCLSGFLLTLGACSNDSNEAPDASARLDAAPPADAPAAQADADRTLGSDAAPLYACPSAVAPGSIDGGGLLPSRHSAGAVPVLAAPLTPDPVPTSDVVFTVDTSQGMWVISQDIYGMNSPGPKTGVDPTVRTTSERLGGNRLSAYNWENNASNAGKDYKYQNDGYLSTSDAAGDAVRFVLDDVMAMGAGAVLTVPIGDYVAADKAPGGDVRGDGGTGYLSARFKKNVAKKGAPFSNPPDQGDDSVFQDEFAAWATDCAGTVPVAFALDNEPDLWSSTHAEIHPDATTYVEMVRRTTSFASAIKAAWPAAPILGFVSYGWNGFVSLQNAPDADGKGEFVDYFLAQMKSAEDSAGRRLVDYLDLHWYPEATGGGVRITNTAPTDATKLADYQNARLQAPRSLWDSSYKETSWIISSIQAPINLIPRMRQKIATNYPGTKLAFTEWNYGGGSDITGAIATADVLGIFGREHVDMAHIWPLSSKEPFIAAGMRVFRNYDGKSGEFGDIAIAASNSDTVNTSVYASLSSSNPNQVVVVAINKKNADVVAGLRLAHPGALASTQVFVLAGTSPVLTAAPDLSPVGVNAYTYTMPARSVSVLVFSASGGQVQPLDGGVDGPGAAPFDATPIDLKSSEVTPIDVTPSEVTIGSTVDSTAPAQI